ncbi:MAG: orotate phosphoribosyltransferase [Candidatus Brocadiaceae bacterium]|nr:orotate phosphoribosyltransferase [Candidatus Brocadiaceae bacterium]
MDIRKDMEDLLKILVEQSFKYSDAEPFKLASGKTSNYYINCKSTTLDSRAMCLIGRVFYHKIKDLGVKAVGGVPLGADPIVAATAFVSAQDGNPLQAFIVRKEQKQYGLMKTIEGNVDEGDKVVIIDDVITTGGSTLEAIDKSRAFGLDVVKAIVLVDRQEGGRENIEKKGVPLEAIYTRDDLIRCHRKKHP